MEGEGWGERGMERKGRTERGGDGVERGEEKRLWRDGEKGMDRRGRER